LEDDRGVVATQERRRDTFDEPAGASVAGPPREPATRRGLPARIGLRIARVLGIIVLVIVAAFLSRLFGLDSIPAVLVASVIGLGALLVTQKKPRRTRRRGLHLGMTALGVLLLVGIAASTWSYAGYLSAPGAATVAVRTSDWMRDHHLNWIVDRLEQKIYAGSAPANGHVRSDQLPSTPIGHAAGSHPADPAHRPPTVPALMPPTVQNLIDNQLAGEGQWLPNARQANGRPVDYTTFIRPDRDHTNVVASAVWFDPQATRITYVPGTKQKGTWAWGSGVPAAQRPNLVAAFNSGFKFKDIPGGSLTEGRTPVPLVDGQASLVLGRNGAVDLGAWGSEVKMTPDVISVRQNLALLVDNGSVVPGLLSTKKGAWGSSKWQLQYTNRSGVGITAQHALVFVAGANLNTESLAKALVDVGSVRGMELDIHASNPTLNFFTQKSGGGPADLTGTKLYPAMKSAADRFLAPDQRDFYAVTVADPAKS
jgi:hypothetical protein